ncbi:hypothetical protein LOTGIDRAFT_175894 [Lottia gigantea]|uniref:Endonuclease/exonuclease/phosphatase domain-containing protein n=1 Tax=Lottia gigantea TaxID=225164 RepID=V3ZV21_LOTGI|nr:hypothetical protein LOTGIDRAFT_175894 [Lottia gigantea]ESO88222.1 hypothetical protein LOTGIDRAFT_175894 [Lottia gigantea]
MALVIIRSRVVLLLLAIGMSPSPKSHYILLCSLSLNPRELDNLVAQLPSPYILLGDFNGHHSFWGSFDDNSRGKLIADFIYDNDLCISNDESPTHFCSKNKSFSHLDLTISSPSLFQDFSWSVHDDLCHSDHYPVILRNNGPSPVDRPQRWKLSKANWPLFEALCISSFPQDDLDEAEDQMELFTTILQDVSGQAIRKTLATPKRFNKPWFEERNRALRLLERSPTDNNVASFRIARAKARRTIRQAKRSSWQEYVSRINSRTSCKSVWDRIRRIKGKADTISVNHLQIDGSTLTTLPDIANSLGHTFSYNSSSNFSSDAFRRVKLREERKKVNLHQKTRNIIMINLRSPN